MNDCESSISYVQYVSLIWGNNMNKNNKFVLASSNPTVGSFDCSLRGSCMWHHVQKTSPELKTHTT